MHHMIISIQLSGNTFFVNFVSRSADISFVCLCISWHSLPEQTSFVNIIDLPCFESSSADYPL